MEITINKTSECQASLTATATPQEVSAIKDNCVASYQQNARIPGFRAGKAPKSLIVKRYASAIQEELEYRIKYDVQEKALDQYPDMKVLDFGTPAIAENEDGSCTLTSTLTIVPQFELPEYMGIEVKLPSTEVSDDEVQETLQKYAEASARHEVVERAGAKGDIAVIDFTTTIEGKPTAEYCGKPVGFMEGREGHWMALEEDSFVPGLPEGLIGLAAGESKEIVVTMKEDFPISDLAGKEVTFACTVKEVREKQVPEVTAELFAEALPGKSLDEIKDIVRGNIKSNKERANDEAKADQISEYLADKLSFELPEDIVQRENDNTVQRKLYAAVQAGDYEAMKDMDAVRAECVKETERNLRVYFALQEIALKEKVDVTDEELLNAMYGLAEQAKEKDIKKFIRKMYRENRVTGIRLSLVTSKVIDLLGRNAKVTVEGAAEEASTEA